MIKAPILTTVKEHVGVVTGRCTPRPFVRVKADAVVEPRSPRKHTATRVHPEERVERWWQGLYTDKLQMAWTQQASPSIYCIIYVLETKPCTSSTVSKERCSADFLYVGQVVVPSVWWLHGSCESGAVKISFRHNRHKHKLQKCLNHKLQALSI